MQRVMYQDIHKSTVKKITLLESGVHSGAGAPEASEGSPTATVKGSRL